MSGNAFCGVMRRLLRPEKVLNITQACPSHQDINSLFISLSNPLSESPKARLYSGSPKV
jgi:hypothetical protein